MFRLILIVFLNGTSPEEFAHRDSFPTEEACLAQGREDARKIIQDNPGVDRVKIQCHPVQFVTIPTENDNV